MDQMGSPYLLAHGLGVPVKDATTTVTLPDGQVPRLGSHAGLGRDMERPGMRRAGSNCSSTAPLCRPTSARRTPTGTGRMAAWSRSRMRQGEIALHDLTGFEGRCDADLVYE